MSQFVDPKNSRPGVYGEVIHKILEEGVCPFCPEHLAEFHTPAATRRGAWVVTDNMYPYKPTKHCRLFIHEQHITHVSEISEAAWMELREIINEECVTRGIVGGTLMMRFGETKFTGSSVTHLHAHLLQSDPDDATYDQARGITVRLG